MHWPVVLFDDELMSVDPNRAFRALYVFLERRRGLSVYTPAALAEVAAAFDNRPRAALGFRTPIEALCELLARPT